MNDKCNCCEGMEAVTPLSTVNRPGLTQLTYRIGTHASFLETMLVNLSSQQALEGLTERITSDFSIALLDAWATVADVLTFYQERIVNEGYLRTATERRSILELARLIGYTPRPGVASSVYLAYTLEDIYDNVEIPTGARVQSVPGPGELPQTFETAEKLVARAAWNTLQVRLNQPQRITLNSTNPNPLTDATQIQRLFFEGITTNLRPNDPLLLVFEGNSLPVFRQVITATIQPANNRTEVALQPLSPSIRSSDLVPTKQILKRVDVLSNLVSRLEVPQARQPFSPQRLERTIKTVFAPEADTGLQLLSVLRPLVGQTLYSALANTEVTLPPTLTDIQALRVKASTFGHNAPLKPILTTQGAIVGYEEWPLTGTSGVKFSISLRSVVGANIPQFPVILTISQGTGIMSRNVSLTETVDPVTVQLGNDNASLRLSRIGLSRIDERALEYQIRFRRQQIIVIVPPALNEPISVSIGSNSFQLEQGDVRTSGEGIFIDRKDEATSSSSGEFLLITIQENVALSDAARKLLLLDSQYDRVLPESWIAVERNGVEVYRVDAVQSVSIPQYGLTGKVTQLTLDRPWLSPDDRLLSAIRSTTVYIQGESLVQAEEPIADPVDPPTDASEQTIYLDGLYDGLQSGRWAIVTGERVDILGTTGVQASELVMIASVRQGPDPDLPSDQNRTRLTLARKLAYSYRRDTVKIYANVVRATNGETRTEILGSGDSAKALQQFTLRQPPLTYVSAPTANGLESTLQVRVNDVLRKEVTSLEEFGSSDRVYTTKTNDDGMTTVTFGDGVRGARLPTGTENVRAVYRSGIGKVGNVGIGQISQLATRPLGVRSVTNPQRASGGADPESRDQARSNAPLAVTALDRLVSVQDYADFTRTFAGVAKASAVRLSDGLRQLVHVTIAGSSDAPIDQSSDLFRNLTQALVRFGDPSLPLQVAVRELLLLVIVANVRVKALYAWESVERKVRDALLKTFSFERCELGQSVFLSDVLSTIQQVEGVEYTDVDILGQVSEQISIAGLDGLAENLQGLSEPTDITVRQARINSRRILPAQLAYLSPTVPDTLILRVLP
jgi:predicted phage baseplate assembly protein